MTCHSCHQPLHANSTAYGFIHCKPCRRKIWNDNEQKSLGEFIAEFLLNRITEGCL